MESDKTPLEPIRGGFDIFSSALFSILLVGLLALIVFGLTSRVPGSDNLYGWGLFVIIPMLLGAVATLFYSGGHKVWPAIMAGWLALLLTCLTVAIVAIEGIVCLIMAAPILMGASALGSVGVAVAKNLVYDRKRHDRMMASFLVLAPALVFLDARTPHAPAHAVVSTSIVIHASADRVWQELHNFQVRDEPNFWLFRSGVAYPMASITDGEGMGARRICRLSTGDMIETIDGWEPGKRLHFKALATPDCMTETTLYGRIVTPHLRGYYESEAGQFGIRPLPNGSVEVIGTSWYRLSLYPSAYWQLWSDAIVHQVQLRVLEDIRRRAEG